MQSQIEPLMKSLIKAGFPIVLAVSGVGCKALSWFTTYAGSSNFALEASNLHSQGSLNTFLGQKISNKYSKETADLMAQECLIRAHQILRFQDEPDREKFYNSVGISMVGACSTVPNGKNYLQAYASIILLHRSYSFLIQIESGSRTNQEDDEYASLLLLRLVSDLIQGSQLTLSSEVQILSVNDRQDVFNFLRYNPNKFFNILFTSGGQVQLNTILENSVIMSGSFNPLHEAHIQIAKLTADLVKIPYDKIYYELSIINADKGSIETSQIEQRLEQFTSQNLNIIISARPLFKDKNIFLRNGAFSIGADTYKRLIDLKYYNHSKTDRDISYIEYLKNNNQIIVAPRLSVDKLETLKDFDVPNLIKQLVREIDFRLDISSTQLREKRAKSVPQTNK